MKSFALFLLAGTLTFGISSLHAQGGNPNLSQGVEPVGLFGHTPAPTPNKAAVAGPKKPLEGVLAKDEKGKSSTSVFSPTDSVYLVWKDETGAKGDHIRIVWIAEDTGKAFAKNKKISEYAQTLPNAGAFNSFAKVGNLPPGKYRADVYDGSQVVRSLKFTVKK